MGNKISSDEEGQEYSGNVIESVAIPEYATVRTRVNMQQPCTLRVIIARLLRRTTTARKTKSTR
jgi:hypothetical protein